MPGKDSRKVENQEPAKQENKSSETKNDSKAVPYEHKVFEALTGVVDSEEESS